MVRAEILTVDLCHTSRRGEGKREGEEHRVTRNPGHERHIVEILTQVGQFPGFVSGVRLRGVDRLDDRGKIGVGKSTRGGRIEEGSCRGNRMCREPRGGEAKTDKSTD